MASLFNSSSLTAFVVARAIAQNRGISSAEVNRIALIGAVIKPPILGIILAASIATNETPTPAVTSSATPQRRGLFGRGRVSLPASSAPNGPAPAPGTAVATTPSFHGLDRARAEAQAKTQNLSIRFEGTHKSGHIDWQEPESGKPLPPDSTVKVRLASPSE